MGKGILWITIICTLVWVFWMSKNWLVNRSKEQGKNPFK